MKWILWAILGIVVLVVIFLVYSDAQAKKFAEAERKRQITTPTTTQAVPAQNWVDSLTVLIHGGKGIIEGIKQRQEQKRQESEVAIRLARQQGMTQQEALAML